ncbi:hypothetical protein [Lactiplantibacillus plantarum]|uniref:hypothetical protein n=1 Tax=Lactiplantibacillus plantarum TaxID=1590 RepID=UPI000DAEB625|nr:hypothetical protein [Lactiplantibacillus plantarum]KAF1282563.1 hypothetical protein CHF38_12275 [Lactiplantibacillus plantarum]MDY8144931.1 hypothetical protein [Lactiplantibacillus plantarum]RAH94346.1 hypothetical protein DAY22_12265 [Lactiplantibacillus plantarum]
MIKNGYRISVNFTDIGHLSKNINSLYEKWLLCQNDLKTIQIIGELSLGKCDTYKLLSQNSISINDFSRAMKHLKKLGLIEYSVEM